MQLKKKLKILNNKKINNLEFLTVVLLTYNRVNYAQKAIDAILQQTYSNFKIIIIDNHSTDGTVEIITSQIKEDERITYIRLNNKSNAGNSFHMGVMLSRSEFVLVTHDDDILDIDYVENIINVCKINPDLGLIAANAKLIDENGRIINNHLYSLEKDLKISKGNYLEYYLKQKLWLPTPSLCFRKLHYLNFAGHDIYPMYTKKGAIKNREVVKYTPSGDILFNLYINQFQSIYMFHHPYFSYRQHKGQESRNVNQSEPMLWLFENIKKSKIKIKNENIYINIKAKYTIQNYLFKNDAAGLKQYLDYEKKCVHVLLAKSLFFKNKNLNLLKDVPVDVQYSDFLCTTLNDLKLDNVDLLENKKQIVLVGSMLCSFYVDAYLRLKGIIPFAVIDFAQSRQGEMINSNKVLSYEQFFEKNKNEYIFLVTSEREKDISIINKIKEHGGIGTYIYWQELFPSKGI